MLTPSEAAALLDKAAALLESTTRTGVEARFRPGLFGQRQLYRVSWQWPGVLRVFGAESGELLAESQTGNPRVLKRGATS